MSISLENLRKIDRIHPYPAKFTVDLAMDYISKYTKENDIVYDPFVGSGTTLLTSKYLNRNAFGTDINFIAILISKAKTLKFNDENLKNLEQFINNFEINYKEQVVNVEKFYYKSIEHWFCDAAIAVLSLIKKSINNLDNENERIFSQMVMSSIINLASNQESDTRYAAILKPKINVDYVATTYVNKFRTALSLYKDTFGNMECEQVAILDDSKNCTNHILKKSVNLILTSPPYPNTYDYYLYHKHRMNWLGFDVNYSMNNEIGSRREFSSLKHPKSKFNDDMYDILSKSNEVLKLGGFAVLVMGDGKIQGEIYDAKENMISVCEKLNWKLIDYTFSYLDQTSRSFQQSYRTKGKKEHILVFQKVVSL